MDKTYGGPAGSLVSPPSLAGCEQAAECLMTFHVDPAPDQNPHVNHEPSSLNGLTESPRTGKNHEPVYGARLIRQKIGRRRDIDLPQAGDRYREHDERENTRPHQQPDQRAERRYFPPRNSASDGGILRQGRRRRRLASAP